MAKTNTHYPVTHDDGTTDKRYSVRLEYVGEINQRLVLRFEGEWLGTHRNLADATLRAIGHKAVMNGATIITEQRG